MYYCFNDWCIFLLLHNPCTFPFHADHYLWRNQGNYSQHVMLDVLTYTSHHLYLAQKEEKIIKFIATNLQFLCIYIFDVPSVTFLYIIVILLSISYSFFPCKAHQFSHNLLNLYKIIILWMQRLDLSVHGHNVKFLVLLASTTKLIKRKPFSFPF